MDYRLDVKIKWLGGNCPVQSEGTLNNYPYYFRARGNKWTLYVATETYPDPLSNTAWSYSEEYGTSEFEAGWMPVEEAEAFLRYAARKWFNEYSR